MCAYPLRDPKFKNWLNAKSKDIQLEIYKTTSTYIDRNIFQFLKII